MKYYKYSSKCRKCGLKYGHDQKKDDGLCPLHTLSQYQVTKKYAAILESKLRNKKQ